MISISIIIPIYNVEKYIERCIRSVMDQTFLDTSIECILVDDESLDDSMAIVKDMLQAYHGAISFRIITHNKNMGLSMARNTGTLEAQGDYIFFMDSDDYLMTDALSLLVDQAIQYPDVDIIIGNALNKKSDQPLHPYLHTTELLDSPDEFFQRMLRHKIYLYAWNKLIRRTLLIDNNILFISGILYEDQAWSYHLFSCAHSVLLLPQVTYVYENNPQSIVNTTFTSERVEWTVRSYAVSTTYILDNPPDSHRYERNMTVDYLLFMGYFLMNGIDLESKFSMSSDVVYEFRLVRSRLMHRSLRYGRLLLSLFFVLLFTPMCYIQRLRWFRSHYDRIELTVSLLAHATDFLHNKHRQI